MMELSKNYIEFLESLKKEILAARTKAHFAVNAELILLYWKIGQQILEQQQQEGWGTKVIEQLAQDLRYSFPEMKELSERNLKYMRKFAAEFPDFLFVQQVAAQLPWGHILIILDKLPDFEKRSWYAHQTIKNGWSRNVLVMQIESDLYHRQGKAFSNFANTLPQADSDLAQQTFKNHYNLEFLNLETKVKERVLEKALVNNIRDFLLELGTGFAFVGSQYKLTVGEDDFYIDLLFYHTRLRCYMVIKLKTGKFLPAYTGQLGFYLAAINGESKHPDDKPTIGLLLCQTSNQLAVEYALQGHTHPMSIAHFNHTNEMSQELKDNLPSVEQLQHYLHLKKAEEFLKDEPQEYV